MTTEDRTSRWRWAASALASIAALGALAAIAVILSHARQSEPEQRSAVLAPGQSEGPTPDVRFLLDHRSALKLTKRQASRIEVLSAAERRETAPLQKQLGAITQDFEGWLQRQGADDPHARGAGPGEIAERIQAVRKRYWQNAVSLLTPGQKRIISGIRRAEMQKALERLRG